MNTQDLRPLTTSMNNTVLQKIEYANQKHCLFYEGQKILCGLSGGADSVCLLVSLCELSQKYGFSVGAVHVNHMIRGKEADRDEEFSKALCQRLSVEFFCERRDVPTFSKEQGLSLELCARNERYKFFEEICKNHGYTTLATAHNANDNAETFLINAIRGCSLKGLCAIPVTRRLSKGCDVTIIRPLLYVERAEIEAFLREKEQGFVTDSTNLSDDYTRNCIRHKILPQMQDLNTSVVKTLCMCAETLKKDSEFLEKLTEQSFTDKVSQLKKLDYSLQSRIIAKMYAACANNEYIIEKKHIDEIISKINQSLPDKAYTMSLPGKITLTCSDGVLSFTKKECKKEQEIIWDVMLKDGINLFANSKYLILVENIVSKEHIHSSDNFEHGQNIYKIYKTDYIYSDTMLGSLCARARVPGQKFLQNGIHKSVKRLMCDKKIPLCDRETLPFIYADNALCCIPGVGVSDGFNNTNNNHITKITVYKKICGTE